MSELTFDEQKARNRALMPATAAIVDEFRRRFGAGVRLLYAKEGAVEVGQRSAATRSMDATQWLHFMATGELPAEA